MKYRVVDEKENNVLVTNEDGKILLNGKEVSLDLKEIKPGQYHIIKEHKSYNIQVLSQDLNLKTFKIKVNNQVFDLSLQTSLDELLNKMGMSLQDSQKVDNIKAPMPGLVLQILVEKGQEVKKGDSLIILEAMKMENVIKSSGDGVIKGVKVNKNEAVEKNQVLIEME